jgi:hypothetical protein
MFALENDFTHLPVHLYTTHHAGSPSTLPSPHCLGAAYIMAKKAQVLEMLVYRCMFVTIKYIQKLVLMWEL